MTDTPQKTIRKQFFSELNSCFSEIKCLKNRNSTHQNTRNTIFKLVFSGIQLTKKHKKSYIQNSFFRNSTHQKHKKSYFKNSFFHFFRTLFFSR